MAKKYTAHQLVTMLGLRFQARSYRDQPLQSKRTDKRKNWRPATESPQTGTNSAGPQFHKLRTIRC
jgi:hypothetical protein